jgi:hypothetical protein
MKEMLLSQWKNSSLSKAIDKRVNKISLEICMKTLGNIIGRAAMIMDGSESFIYCVVHLLFTIGELPDDWHRIGQMDSIMDLDRSFLFPGKLVS